jgi:hypothetical protein
MIMRRPIPAPVLAVCAEIVARRESHASLNSLFTYAGASGDPPPGSKSSKALDWLRLVNKEESIKPLEVLGRLIENYMEAPLDPEWDHDFLRDRERIAKILSQFELQHITGGKVVGALGAPSRMLEEFIRDRDLASIDMEFNRALSNVESNPRDAVSAASNILESVCKVYIADENLEEPSKKDLKSVWTIVRRDLGFDPSAVEDQDLQRILSGLISITDGIGALRTHASSAHGAGKKSYKLEARHARLAVHAAHTTVLFVLESWNKKKQCF